VTARPILALGGCYGALGVILGAFGAHALAGRLGPTDLAVYETAVRYQMYHALALVGLAGWIDRQPSLRLEWAAGAFGLGVLVFSGSLYLLVFTGQRWLGAVTPLGGIALILGWLLIAMDALSRKLPSQP
jgi:uncharacterized membrane protein YgdD (TMEM256/DUF423 family)